MGFANPWDGLAYGACLLGTKPMPKKPQKKSQKKSPKK